MPTGVTSLAMDSPKAHTSTLALRVAAVSKIAPVRGGAIQCTVAPSLREIRLYLLDRSCTRIACRGEVSSSYFYPFPFLRSLSLEFT